jgi:cytochrome c biogenesis protein CcdA
MDILNRFPAAAQPYFLPVLGVVVVVMGFVALASFNNPAARAAVKEHGLWIVVGAVLVFGGVGIVTNFLAGIGAH